MMRSDVETSLSLSIAEAVLDAEHMKRNPGITVPGQFDCRRAGFLHEIVASII
jgi:hypothetical protein